MNGKLSLHRIERYIPTAHFSGHCFRLIPASGSFAASAFPVPPLHHCVPSHKAAARFGSSSLRFWVPQKNGAEKGDIFHVLLELSNDRQICSCRPGAASSAEQRFEVHLFPSPDSAPGETQKTNGSRKSSGIALRYFALDWPRLFSTTSRKALMCSSKAVWSARPTSRRMADVRLIKMPSTITII